jgi:arsenate reductase
VLKLLFICTHNRCRSILCEALARHLGAGRIEAYSAGSQPSGVVHPDTLKHLERRGVDTQGLKSQSWDVYADLSPDAVITVCDQAAGESCPLWLGQSLKVHWGLSDPSRVDDACGERDAAFEAVIETVERRLGRLLSQSLDGLAGEELRARLQQIAREEP